LTWAGGDPEGSKWTPLVVGQCVGSPLLHRPVEPLAYLFTVGADIVRGDECVAVLFAVGGNFRKHPSPLAIGR
jgi:hypothetical protein